MSIKAKPPTNAPAGKKKLNLKTSAESPMGFSSGLTTLYDSIESTKNGGGGGNSVLGSRMFQNDDKMQ